jgi:hypothetical protein
VSTLVLVIRGAIKTVKSWLKQIMRTRRIRGSASHINLNFRPNWPRDKLNDVEEIAVACIALKSTLNDMTCVYGRNYKNKIYYRVSDDNGFGYGEQKTRSLERPLTLGELTDYFLRAWDLFEVLKVNFADDGYPPEKVWAFFEASSELYPDFGKLVKERVERWLRRRARKES